MSYGRLKERVVYILPLLVLAFLLFILNVTNPLTVGPIGSLAVFVLIFVLMASSLRVVIMLTFKTVQKKRVVVFASFIALGAVALLALNSLGQLNILNLFLCAFLVVLAIFYFAHRRSPGL